MAVIEDIYPSRISDKPEIVDRQDPVVWSEGSPQTPHLTDAQVDSYRRNGYLSIPSLFSPKEVELLRRDLFALAEQQDIRDAKESIIEPGGGAVRSIFRIHALSDTFDQLSRDPRLLHVAQYLLGDDVYIHQSRANMKPGFRGKEFYWHSDFETWHVEDGMPRMRTVSCSVALTPNYPYNGPLMLIPGSQNKYVRCIGETPEDNYKNSLKKQETGVPDNESMEKLAEEGGIDVPVGPAGSVTFFECNTMHGSNSNITPFPRSNAFFVYNAMSNRVVEPFGGTKPRPEFIATREHIEALTEGR